MHSKENTLAIRQSIAVFDVGRDPWFMAPPKKKFLGEDHAMYYVQGIDEDGYPFIVFPEPEDVHGGVIWGGGTAFRYQKPIKNHPTRPSMCSTHKEPPKIVSKYIRSPEDDREFCIDKFWEEVEAKRLKAEKDA